MKNEKLKTGCHPAWGVSGANIDAVGSSGGVKSFASSRIGGLRGKIPVRRRLEPLGRGPEPLARHFLPLATRLEPLGRGPQPLGRRFLPLTTHKKPLARGSRRVARGSERLRGF